MEVGAAAAAGRRKSDCQRIASNKHGQEAMASVPGTIAATGSTRTSRPDSDSLPVEKPAGTTASCKMTTTAKGVVHLVKLEVPEPRPEVQGLSDLDCDAQALALPLVETNTSNDHAVTVASDSESPMAPAADLGMSGTPDSESSEESELKHHDQAPGSSIDAATCSSGTKVKCAQHTNTRTPTNKLHKTLRGDSSLKPKRRLNRDYSQPGKFRGVRFRGKGRYSAELKVKEERRWLGIFTTPEEAARAFDKAAFEVRGRAARLNFPELIVGAGANRWLHRPWNAGVMMDQESEREDRRIDDDINRDASSLRGTAQWYNGTSLPLAVEQNGSIIQSGSRFKRGVEREWEDVEVSGEEKGQQRGIHGAAVEADEWERIAIDRSADETGCQQRIMQGLDFASRQPKAETSTCDCGVSHTMACGHTVTCTSTSPFPPTTRFPSPGPHTHPLSARPSLWSDLDADPLSLHPPMLDVFDKCSHPDADTSPLADAVASSLNLLDSSTRSNLYNVNPMDSTNDLPDSCGAKFR